MSRLDRAVVLAALLVMAALAVSLALPRTGEDRPWPSPGVVPPPEPPTLYEGIVGPVVAINPLVAQTAADRDLVSLVFSGLTRAMPDGAVAPDLAESWTVDPDGLGYTFTIRPGLTWHDGRPLTADDVVFTVLTIQDPAYRGALRASWETVTVSRLDARIVRFTLTEPLGGFLQATTLPILPAHRLLDVPVADLAAASFNREPVGSGAWRLISFEAGEAVLERVEPPSATPDASPEPTPPGGPIGEPQSVGRIVVRVFPDAATLAAAYAAGTVDAAAGLPPGQVADLASLSGTRVLRYSSSTFVSVVLNLRPGRTVFGDVDVRRGLLQALDREAIIRTVYGGYAVRADSPISPSSWAYDAETSTVHAHDRDGAARSFQAAGWKRGEAGWVTGDGDPVAFSLAALDPVNDPLGNVLAEEIADTWRSLGLDVAVESYPPDPFVAQVLVPGDYAAAVLNVNMGLDPDVYPLLASPQAIEGGSNVSGYQSAALDALLKAARLAADRETRRARFSELQAALTRDVPMLPIVFPDQLYVVRDTVLGPAGRQVADRSARFWDVLTWRLADGQSR